MPSSTSLETRYVIIMPELHGISVVFLSQMIFQFQQAKVYVIVVNKTSHIGNYACFAALYQMKRITQLTKYVL